MLLCIVIVIACSRSWSLSLERLSGDTGYIETMFPVVVCSFIWSTTAAPNDDGSDHNSKCDGRPHPAPASHSSRAIT